MSQAAGLFGLAVIFNFLHLSEQYLTSFQTFSRFLRQLKGRLQVTQIFWGSCDLLPLNVFTTHSTSKRIFC